MVMTQLAQVTIVVKGRSVTIHAGDVFDGGAGNRFEVVDLVQHVDEHGQECVTVILRRIGTGHLLSESLELVTDLFDDGDYTLLDF
jgi:hypothetical protein